MADSASDGPEVSGKWNGSARKHRTCSHHSANDLPFELSHSLPARVEQALNSPIRRQILRLLNRDPSSVLSPSELVAKGEPPKAVRLMAYHTKVLADCGAISLEANAPSGATLKHFYRSAVADDPRFLEILKAMEKQDEGFCPQG